MVVVNACNLGAELQAQATEHTRIANLSAECARLRKLLGPMQAPRCGIWARQALEGAGRRRCAPDCAAGESAPDLQSRRVLRQIVSENSWKVRRRGDARTGSGEQAIACSSAGAHARGTPQLRLRLVCAMGPLPLRQLPQCSCPVHLCALGVWVYPRMAPASCTEAGCPLCVRKRNAREGRR